jgi:hypothetical protein
MYANFWNQILPELKRLESILSTPYAWNSKEKRFSLIHHLSYVKINRALFIFSALHLPFICWNLLQTLRNETNILLIIFAFGYTSITSGSTVVRWMYQNQHISGDIVKLLNATVDLQKLSTLPGKTSLYDKNNNLRVSVGLIKC